MKVFDLVMLGLGVLGVIYVVRSVPTGSEVVLVNGLRNFWHLLLGVGETDKLPIRIIVGPLVVVGILLGTFFGLREVRKRFS